MSLASLAQQKLLWMLFIALTAYSFHAHLCGFTLWFGVFLISLSRLVLYVFNNLNFIIFCFLHRKLIRSLILSPSCMLLDVKGFSSFNTVRKEGQTQRCRVWRTAEYFPPKKDQSPVYGHGQPSDESENPFQRPDVIQGQHEAALQGATGGCTH